MLYEVITLQLAVDKATSGLQEAERCARIVYLANGQKIVEGTVGDVIARSSLITFRGEGPGVRRLADAIRNEPGIEHAAYFGSALHVSGKDRAAIKTALERHKAHDVSWSVITSYSIHYTKLYEPSESAVKLTGLSRNMLSMTRSPSS